MHNEYVLLEKLWLAAHRNLEIIKTCTPIRDYVQTMDTVASGTSLWVAVAGDIKKYQTQNKENLNLSKIKLSVFFLNRIRDFRSRPIM